jgi:hypothetical protein
MGVTMNSIRKLLIGIGWLLIAIFCFLLSRLGEIAVLASPSFIAFFIGIVFLLAGMVTKD